MSKDSDSNDILQQEALLSQRGLGACRNLVTLIMNQIVDSQTSLNNTSVTVITVSTSGYAARLGASNYAKRSDAVSTARLQHYM